MEIAKKLCDKIYSLIENQKRCAPQLVNLAEEVESQRTAYTVAKYDGNTASVLGSAAVVGPVVGAVGGAVVRAKQAAGQKCPICGGLVGLSLGPAIPRLVTATVAAGATVGGAGVVINLGAQLFEWMQSSSTLKDAEKIIEKIRKLREKIERLQKELKEECEKSPGGPDPMEYILRSIAMRSGVEWATDDPLLRVMTNWPNHRFSVNNIHRGHGDSFHLMLAFPVLGAACLALVPKKVGKAVLKATLAGTLKGAAQIGGGVLGVALSLPGMISNIKELVKGDVTEASQSLRNAAKEMKTVAEDLEKELDSIQEIIKEMSEVKSSIESLDYSDPATKKSESQIRRERIILDFLKKTSQNKYLLQWIKSMANFALFLTLVLYLNKLLQEHKKKKKKKKQTDEVDIIIVAHGEITKHHLPARLLVPSPAIKDTILYSPWNCAIDSKVAYGIAKGCIRPNHRAFFCSWCKAPEANHRPSDLPGSWNHMKDAGLIPEIILRPVNPDEDAWKRLGSLDKELPEGRILLPYLLPKGVNPELFPGVPFHIFISALNLVLTLCGVKATVHLAAFLCQYSRRDDVLLEYSYADDYTIMTTTDDMKVDRQSDLYKAFRPMFGESPSCRSRSYHL